MPSSQRTHSRDLSDSPLIITDVEIEQLQSVQLFKDVKKDQLARLLGSFISRICHLGANQKLWPKTGQGSDLYVILSGYVAIWISSRFNPLEETFLAWRGPEQLIGEMKPSSATISLATVTTCDPCQLLQINNNRFVKLAEDNPIIYRNMAELLVRKIAAERERSEVIKARPARRQVAQALSYLAEERCSNVTSGTGPQQIPGIINQDELAAYIGVRRETVNHALVALRKSKIIWYPEGSHHGEEITILDRVELIKIAIVRKSARKPKVKTSDEPRTRIGIQLQ